MYLLDFRMKLLDFSVRINLFGYIADTVTDDRFKDVFVHIGFFAQGYECVPCFVRTVIHFQAVHNFSKATAVFVISQCSARALRAVVIVKQKNIIKYNCFL